MSEYFNDLYSDGRIKAMDHRFVEELEAAIRAYNNSRGLVMLLDELAKAGAKPKTPIQMLIHKELVRSSGYVFRFRDEDFKKLYLNLNTALNKRFILTTSKQPPSEKIFIKKLKQSFGRQVFQSVFIGPSQYDALVMSLRIGKLPGVAFEVNGGCHYREGKMSKDTQKKNFIEKVVGVSYLPIEDGELYSGNYDATINDFKTRASVDSRMMKRRWRKIYVETLAHWAYLRGGKAEARKLIQEFLWLKKWSEVEALVNKVESFEM